MFIPQITAGLVGCTCSTRVMPGSLGQGGDLWAPSSPMGEQRHTVMGPETAQGVLIFLGVGFFFSACAAPSRARLQPTRQTPACFKNFISLFNANS